MEKNKKKPLVSVRVVTYNQKDYIVQCLDSIVSQKTTFPFEIAISDDCSTDGTTEIIQTYFKRYPGLFRDISPKKNIGAFENFFHSVKNCCGKYTALIDGDDYWCDDLKLQKQVDFMETHPNYSCCFHKVKVISENTQPDNIFDILREGNYSEDQIMAKWLIQPSSYLFRTELASLMPEDKTGFMYDDIILFLTVAEHGKCYCMNDIMSVYRRSDESWIGKQRGQKEIYEITKLHYKTIGKHFRGVSKKTLIVLNIKNSIFKSVFYIRKFLHV